MAELVRVSLSLEKSLLDRLENLVAESGYGNRSEFIRDLVRERLVQEEWTADQDVIGTISMIYNHHTRLLQEKLTDVQHDHHHSIMATTHLHLDHELCLEVLSVKGTAQQIRQLTNSLRQQKGVLHVTLAMTSTGKELK